MSNPKRADRFLALQNDIFYSRLVKRLKADEREYCLNFCNQHNDLDVNQWAFKVNRLFVDELQKPKNATLMWELLSICK